MFELLYSLMADTKNRKMIEVFPQWTSRRITGSVTPDMKHHFHLLQITALPVLRITRSPRRASRHKST
jgi:hypothetical protein